jgi:hypothetical protein
VSAVADEAGPLGQLRALAELIDRSAFSPERLSAAEEDWAAGVLEELERAGERTGTRA